MKILSILTLLACFLGTTVLAQEEESDADSFQLGVVDFQKALNSVEEGKKAKAELEERVEDRRKEMAEKEEELRKLQQELTQLQTQAASGVLSEEKMQRGQRLEKEFQEKLQEFQGLQEQSKRDLSLQEMEATQGIIERMRDIVVEISKEDGFEMVVEENESGLLFARNHTDITDRLIEKYNERHQVEDEDEEEE